MKALRKTLRKKILKRKKTNRNRTKRNYKKGGEINTGNPWSIRCKNDTKYTNNQEWANFLASQTDWKMLQNEYNKCCPHAVNPASIFGKFKGIPNQRTKCKQMRNLVDKLWKLENTEIIIPQETAMSQRESDVYSGPEEEPQANIYIPYVPPKNRRWL
jgi:hypothetical protein